MHEGLNSAFSRKILRASLLALTCALASRPLTLVEGLQEDPAHSAARPTTEHARNDIIQCQQGKSAFGGQVGQDEAGFLHPVLGEKQHPSSSMSLTKLP